MAIPRQMIITPEKRRRRDGSQTRRRGQKIVMDRAGSRLRLEVVVLASLALFISPKCASAGPSSSGTGSRSLTPKQFRKVQPSAPVGSADASGMDRYPEIDGISLGPPEGEENAEVPEPDLAMIRPQALAGVHDPNAPTPEEIEALSQTLKDNMIPPEKEQRQPDWRFRSTELPVELDTPPSNPPRGELPEHDDEYYEVYDETDEMRDQTIMEQNVEPSPRPFQQELIEHFKSHDTDHSGTIELEEVMQSYLPDGAPEMGDYMPVGDHPQGRGMEGIQDWHNQAQEEEEKIWKGIFKQLDTNNDKKISQQEFDKAAMVDTDMMTNETFKNPDVLYSHYMAEFSRRAADVNKRRKQGKGGSSHANKTSARRNEL